MSHVLPELIERYLDADLEPGEQLAVEQHLSGCAVCRDELGRQRALFEELAGLAPLAPPLDLAPLVLARITPAARWPARAWGALAMQAAVCLALAFWVATSVEVWLASLGAALVLPPLALEPAMFAGWARAFGASAADAWARLGALTLGPLATVAPVQWALLLGCSALIWLLGNGVLLGTLGERGRRETERPL